MYEIKLKDLLDKIVDNIQDKEPIGVVIMQMREGVKMKDITFSKELILKWLYKRINIHGENNRHIPLRKDNRDRFLNNELTGDELVKGDYLVYTSQEFSETIYEFRDLKGLEDFIREFHDEHFHFLIPIIKGEIKEYEIEGNPNEISIGENEEDFKHIINRKIKWT